MNSERNNLYLGLDLSSQKLKGIIIDDNLSIVDQQEVHFDTELSEFQTRNGFIQEFDNGNQSKVTVTSPVLMWVKALDLLMQKFDENSANLKQIKAISGCAQQHGTVYWKKGKLSNLQDTSASNSLYDKLKNNFTINDTPVWRDSSTKQYCNLLEYSVGGKLEMAKLTGSTCYERFSGPQIMKIARERYELYLNTERISLISNFLCSLFLGDYAPIEYSDASGMNLMNIRTKKWDENLLKLIDGNLFEKLGPIKEKISVRGKINEYFCNRYGFDKNCLIYSFTGDNLSSFIGLRANKNTIIISLGTSDTVCTSLNKALIVEEGHIFCNAIDQDLYIGVLCYKNGSLVRERFRDKYANGSWELFDDLLMKNPPGNNGYIGLFFDDFEILPANVNGSYRYDCLNNRLTAFPNRETEIRALIEGQIIAKKYHIEHIFNYEIQSTTKIFVTGGASVNCCILQIISDIFQCLVYRKTEPNSAALGGCFIAKYAFEDQLSKITESNEVNMVFSPNAKYANCYNDMMSRYEILAKDLKPTQ